MTTMSGPLNVKRHQTDTTVASIDASGSATFAQGADFGGVVTLHRAIAASGSASFTNGSLTVLGAGRSVVGGSAGDAGDIMLTQSVAIPVNTTKVAGPVLPHGARVVDVKCILATKGASAATDVRVLVGTSAHDARFGAFTVSAQAALHAVSAQTSAWLNVSAAADRQIIVHTTAVSGAIASGISGRIFVVYTKAQ